MKRYGKNAALLQMGTLQNIRGELKKFCESCSHFVIRPFDGINKSDLESPFNCESNCPNGIKKSLTVQKLRRFSSTLFSTPIFEVTHSVIDHSCHDFFHLRKNLKLGKKPAQFAKTTCKKEIDHM